MEMEENDTLTRWKCILRSDEFTELFSTSFLNETMISFKEDLRAKSINSSGDSFIVIFKYTLVVAAIKC